MTVDFCTFCYSGDAPRLHAPGQLKKQVESNSYPFDNIIVVYQRCQPEEYPILDLNTKKIEIRQIDETLQMYGIDIGKPQYVSPTDSHHNWKYHVVNHLTGVNNSDSDYIVFADADCWIVRQPSSWVEKGIEILEQDKSVFIVSPNDGQQERKTKRMSQQMFLARTNEFRNANFNQSGWDGNVNVPGGPIPEYWGMLEGRMELYCRTTNQYRYVLSPQFRYFHHNRLTEDGMFDIDYKKLGWI